MYKGLKMRWITTTTFEIVLPNGKVAIFDPWLGKDPGMPKQFELETTLDDITGADYMFVSHAHGDHVAAVQQINKRFCEGTSGGRIFLPGLSAHAIACKYEIPFRDVVPVFPGETYDLDDMIVTALRCRHRGDDISPLVSRQKSIDMGKSAEDIFLGEIGNIDELDWAVTIKENNFRFMLLGGGVYHFDNSNKFCEQFNPMFVTRQISNILAKNPVLFAQYCHRYHAPYVFPSHHDLGIYESYKDYAPFIKEVNAELEKMGSITRVIDTERGKWYNIDVNIDLA